MTVDIIRIPVLGIQRSNHLFESVNEPQYG